MAALHYEATYPAAFERVMSVLTDPDFLSAYAKEVGALAHDVAVARGGAGFEVQTRVTMTVPTDGVPAVLKRLVTPTVEIIEVRTWQAADETQCRGVLAVDASARGRSARVRGSLLLSSGSRGATQFVVDGQSAVDVRLLGELAAALVKDLVGSVIKRQTLVMERWLRQP